MVRGDRWDLLECCARDGPPEGCTGCLGGSRPALGWAARLQFIYRSNKPALEVSITARKPILKSRKNKPMQAQPGVTDIGQVWQPGVATGLG